MNTSIKVAVASALALGAANAVALTPVQIQTAVGNGTLVRLYVSGGDGSATDAALENLFKITNPSTRLCQPGTLDIYYSKSISGAVSQRALTCTAAFSGTGITSGLTSLALLKESSGGSVTGITGPANGAARSFIDLVTSASNFATACSVATPVGAACSLGAYNYRDCGHVPGLSASNVVRSNFVPNSGISDLDGSFYIGTGAVTTTQVSLLTRRRTGLAVTFNPIVSVPLFTALQRAYGYVGPTASEDTSSLGLVPSLRSSVVRSVFQVFFVLNASQVHVNGVKLQTQMTGLADQSGDIYVCRLGDAAPTMESFRLHLYGQGCNRSAALNNQFGAPDTLACAASGCTWSSAYYNDYVFAGARAADVRACMDYQSAQGRLAVGMADPDSARPGTSSNRYRYIKVDHAEPTLKAVMEGDYEFFTEPSFNDRYSSSSTTGAQTLWDKVYGTFGNPAAVSDINSCYRNAGAPSGPNDGTGDTGFLVTTTTSASSTIATLFSDGQISGAEARATPISGNTRQAVASFEGNNCNLPYQVLP